MPTFAELLAARIKHQKMTDAEVADLMTRNHLIPTSREAVRQWSAGEAVPRAWKWSALLAVLDLPPNEREAWRSALERATAPRPRAAAV